MSPLFLILFPSRQITHGAVSGLASKTARAASAPMRQDCKIDIYMYHFFATTEAKDSCAHCRQQPYMVYYVTYSPS